MRAIYQLKTNHEMRAIKGMKTNKLLRAIKSMKTSDAMRARFGMKTRSTMRAKKRVKTRGDMRAIKGMKTKKLMRKGDPVKKSFTWVETFSIWAQVRFWRLRLYIRNSPKLIEYVAYAFVILAMIFITVYLLIALANTPPVRIR